MSKTRPSSGETSTSEEGCGRTKKDAHSGTAKNAGDNARTGAGEHRGRKSRKKSGICDGNSVGRGDATGAADTAHGIPLASCKGHARIQKDVKVAGKEDVRACGKSRMTRLDDNATDLQGAASQDQAMQVMKQVEQDMEERAKKRETRRRERTI